MTTDTVGWIPSSFVDLLGSLTEGTRESPVTLGSNDMVPRKSRVEPMNLQNCAYQSDGEVPPTSVTPSNRNTMSFDEVMKAKDNGTLRRDALEVGETNLLGVAISVFLECPFLTCSMHGTALGAIGVPHRRGLCSSLSNIFYRICAPSKMEANFKEKTGRALLTS